MPTRSSPAEYAWQVSRQKPASYPPITSHSRASASNRRAHALSPPAVFSISSGTAKPPDSAAYANVLRQLSKPTATSPLSTCPPWTISPRAPTAAAPVACASSSLRLGMRMRLLVDATLMRYGAWMYTSIPPVRSAS